MHWSLKCYKQNIHYYIPKNFNTFPKSFILKVIHIYSFKSQTQILKNNKTAKVKGTLLSSEATSR